MLIRYHSHGNGGWSLLYLNPHQLSKQAPPRVGICLYPNKRVSVRERAQPWTIVTAIVKKAAEEGAPGRGPQKSARGR